MINEKMKLAGHVSIVLRDASGQIKDEREIRNLIVNKGLGYIASRMVNADKGIMTHMGIGSGTAAADAVQSDLVTTLGQRGALASSTIDGDAGEKVVYVASFSAGEGTGAVTEAGIFNSNANDADMLCRTTFGVVNKAPDDTMAIAWTITLSAA